MFQFRFLTGVILVASSAVFCYGQAQSAQPTVVMSPVPFWHNSSLSSLNGQPAAFFDLQQGQLVVVIPDQFSVGRYQQLRYGIPNGTKATINFSLQPSATGAINYTYNLNDDPQARQRTHDFYILLPSHDSTLQAATGVWPCGFVDTAIPDRTSTVALGMMRMVRWTDPAPNASKVYGLTTGLQSMYLPGFAQAFVEGLVASRFTHADLIGLPDNVVAQVQRFFEPGIGSSALTVLAPLFLPGADKLVVADNYFTGLTKLLHTGMLPKDSAYTNALLSAINLFRDTGGEGTLMLPGVMPTNALDATIQEAASLALK